MTRSGSIVSHPSARELPGTPVRRAMNVSSVARWTTPDLSVEDLQQVTRVLADRGRGAEQARVAGSPAERRGILVVHFADEQAAAPGIDLGRRGARLP